MPYCYSVNQQYIVLTKHCAFHDPHLRHSIFFFFDLQAYKEAVSAAPEAQVTTLANGFRVATEQVSEISKYVQLCSLSVKRKRERECVCERECVPLQCNCCVCMSPAAILSQQ